ncbi:MAG: hypothetical protein CMK03_05415 [Ponticaulis sp.]|nr:hypothetical protein [Ponticaulis sp.]
MTDPVELALALVRQRRCCDELRGRIVELDRTVGAQDTRIRELEARLASEKRERDRLQRAVNDPVVRPPRPASPDLAAEQAVLVEALRRRNEELREQLEKARQEGKRQAHPFRRRTTKANPKRPGRKKGQGKFGHRGKPSEEQITRREHAALAACPECGCGDLHDRRTHRNWQIDLPRVMVDITEFVTESAWCPCCGQRVQSLHAEQLSRAPGAAAVCFGPRLLASAADLHARLGVPYGKTADLFSTMTGQSVTAGALCQNVLRLAEGAEPAYRELVEQLRRAMVVHVDETGWRVGTVNAWLWVFTNQDATVYVIRSGEGARGHEAIIEVLGENFGGALVSDCFSAYDKDKLDDWLKQKCFAHLLKDLGMMKETGRVQIAAFITETTACLKVAIALKEHRADLDPGTYGRRCSEVEDELDDILSNYARIEDADAARFVGRLCKQRQHLFTFLYHDAVDPTNNHAERMIRPAVITRKTQGCNKSGQGADAHAVLTSILVTEKQRGESPVEKLVGLVRMRNPLSPPPQSGRTTDRSPPPPPTGATPDRPTVRSTVLRC